MIGIIKNNVSSDTELLQKMDDLLKNLAKQDREYGLIESEKKGIVKELEEELNKNQLQLVYQLADCLDGRLRLLAQSQFIVRSLELLWERQKHKQAKRGVRNRRQFKDARRQKGTRKQKENTDCSRQFRIKYRIT